MRKKDRKGVARKTNGNNLKWTNGKQHMTNCNLKKIRDKQQITRETTTTTITSQLEKEKATKKQQPKRTSKVSKTKIACLKEK